ncbi:28S ribosomal protein S18a, mitochondrial [Aphelenchoides besseyi]|nr:28S ribosomal protein S18a, mitochondrial [Aphelenchoides besseyi]
MFPTLFTRSPNSRTVITTAVRSLKKLHEEKNGNVTRISLVDIEEPKSKREFKKNSEGCALCTCDIPVKVSYRDVLILEQFMRVDGTVLPKELTGLCTKQQLRIERCVMQAHWAGLFPDRTHSSLDRAGFRRFNRYWEDDIDLYRRKIREEPGSWYYIKRYNAKKGEFGLLARLIVLFYSVVYMHIFALLIFLVHLPATETTTCDPDDVDCYLKTDKRDLQLIRVLPGHDAVLPCRAFTSPTTKLEWWVARRHALIARWPNDIVENTLNTTVHYRVSANGSLIVMDANRALVEEYECAVFVDSKYMASSFVLFRLDYSFFYNGPIFSTVFWERINRVRTTVEAMEKYRQKQMENLHDNYQKRIAAIRENCHQQVEQLQKQADRFRDYRQARIENMTQHLDNIRDNYNQQLNRIREYGSRRAEQLIESYDRQLNRMRTFTLQHRLKLMRQYKVKQQYINGLLDNIATSNNEHAIKKNQQEIQEMLNIPDPEFSPRNELTRSASYYSLPEFSSEEYETHIQRSHQRRHFPGINFVDLQPADAALEELQFPDEIIGTSASSSNATGGVAVKVAETGDEINASTPLLENRRPASIIGTMTDEYESKAKMS